MKYLVLLTGPSKGVTIKLNRDVTTIGREESNVVHFDDSNVSRFHAELIRYESGSYRVRDLGSTNGTYINGLKVAEAPLQSGDQIACGDTVMLFEGKKAQHNTSVVYFCEVPEPRHTEHITLDPSKSRLISPEELPTEPREVEHMRWLYRLVAKLAPLMKSERILSLVLEELVNKVEVDRAFVMLGDEAGRLQPTIMRTKDGEQENIRMSVPRDIAASVLETGEATLVVNEVDTDEDAARSLICVPLKSHGRLLGLLYCDTLADTPVLDESALQLLSVVALLTSAHVANAILYEDSIETSNKLESVLRCLRSGVIVTDLEGNVTQVNAAACKILAFDKLQIVGRSLKELPTLLPILKLINGTIESGISSDRQEVVVQISGELVPLGVTTSMLEDSGGHIQGVVTNFQNLSAIKRLSEQVRMSEHLATLGAMAAGIAHEIRNPLNSIRGFAQLINGAIQKSEDIAENVYEYPKIVMEEVDRMNSIVQNLLDYSRQQELTMSMVDVTEFTEQTLMQLGPDIAEAEITLREEFEPHLPATLLNANKLTQVLLNVVRNAIQSMSDTPPEERVLAVKLRSIKTHERITEVAIDVTDNGYGMDEKTVAKVFDPFFTTRDSGTGLGLAICQKIIRQHDGRIEVASELGQGATFSVVLPVR